ncbi:MAG: DUF192 domain-containing protein [Phycisphaeraceae bacterium]
MADGRLIKRVAVRTRLSTALSALLVALVALAMVGCGGGEAERVGSPTQAGSDASGAAIDAAARTVALPIKGRVFALELAIDDAARSQGLSDRQSIDADGGMLFVFPFERQTQFVMRRCYVPIDLIYLDADGYIDSLHAMEVIEPVGGPRWENPASGYPSVGRILYAIELRGGTIGELGLRRGEKLELPEAVLQLKAQ